MAKNKNKRINRLPTDIKDQLIICVQDLINDATLYDSGQFQAIKRSSAVLRMLFYDQGFNHSILNQYADKSKIIFISNSNKVIKSSKYSIGPILAARFEKPPFSSSDYYDTFLFFPDFESKKRITFDDWWNGLIFIFDELLITRCDLIKIIANQDGGAHFDPTISSDFFHLCKGNTGFVMQPDNNNNHLLLGGKPNGKEARFVDIHLTLLRMVVHETIVSLIAWFKLPHVYSPNFASNTSKSLNNAHFSLDILPNV